MKRGKRNWKENIWKPAIHAFVICVQTTIRTTMTMKRLAVKSTFQRAVSHGNVTKLESLNPAQTLSQKQRNRSA